MIAIAVVAGACSAAQADQLVNSDFETGAPGWTVGGPDHLVVSPYGMLADLTPSSSLWSYNTTLLPQMMDLDLDYFATDATGTDPFVIGLHVWGSTDNYRSLPSGPLQDHYGYFLAITQSTESYQVLELHRNDPTGLEVIAGAILPVDGISSHHLRWTDCGCGRLVIDVDGVSVLSIDDSRTGTGRYIGREGTYLGIGTVGTAAGWIDNVLVEGQPVYIPEPATLLLLAAGTGWRRHRR